MTKPRILIIIEDEFLIAPELEARLKSLGYAVVRIGCHWWATGGGVKQRCNSGAYRWTRSPHRDVIGAQAPLGEQLLHVAIRK
jgi:hypothetical protein